MLFDCAGFSFNVLCALGTETLGTRITEIAFKKKKAEDLPFSLLYLYTIAVAFTGKEYSEFRIVCQYQVSRKNL